MVVTTQRFALGKDSFDSWPTCSLDMLANVEKCDLGQLLSYCPYLICVAHTVECFHGPPTAIDMWPTNLVSL